MISNKVYVNNMGKGREETFAEMDRFCSYVKLPQKSKLQIRLLTEELLGMVAQIGGDFDAEYQIEYQNSICRICLTAELKNPDIQKRENLLKASTDGKNAAAKGIMGKIKDIVEMYRYSYNNAVDDSEDIGLSDYASIAMHSMLSSVKGNSFSLVEYKGAIAGKKDSECVEEWDELERSIVANIADDVSVGIRNDRVEIVISKKMKSV